MAVVTNNNIKTNESFIEGDVLDGGSSGGWRELQLRIFNIGTLWPPPINVCVQSATDGLLLAHAIALYMSPVPFPPCAYVRKERRARTTLTRTHIRVTGTIILLYRVSSKEDSSNFDWILYV